jgi:hypothetical protein
MGFKTPLIVKPSPGPFRLYAGGIGFKYRITCTGGPVPPAYGFRNGGTGEKSRAMAGE